jgi:hypothetical protein
VTTSPWPLTVVTNSDYQLSSPVYDSGSKNIFVADLNGYFYSVSATSGTVVGTSSTQLDQSGNGIYDAPLVDSSAQKVYVFVNQDSHGNNGVFQFATSFTAGSGTEETVGTGSSSATSPLLAGAFDNVYYQSTNSSSPSGDLYVVGNTAGPVALYRIPIASNVMGTVASTTVGAGSSSTHSSPVVEFCNDGANACTSSSGATTAGNDYIFFSVYRGASTVLGTSTGCNTSSGNGCVMSINAKTPSSLILGAGLNVTSRAAPPTGGIVIDNSVGSGTEPGASQIYLMTLDNSSSVSCSTAGTGVCAVQASQSAP